MNRAKLRGEPLEEFCKKAYTTTNEYGLDDKRIFCYGWLDSTSDEYLDECKICGALVNNAEPLELGKYRNLR